VADHEPIHVTKTFLPPLEDYIRYLEGIWERNWITNNGPLVQELEQRLKEYLGVKHLFCVSNGTIALQIAIKALGLEGEIITTPFSYVATTSSIVWEGCTPVFVDISPTDLCINPDLIESAITERTTAILATHVYGFPCDVEAIAEIARRHNLKVIYDAAHAYGVRYKGQSVLRFGDISTLSFHATKLFHTAEGGALVTEDDEVAHRISYMRNFGHKGPEEFWGLGINAKMSELHAAMGLCVLPKMAEIIARRRQVCEEYDRLLDGTSLVRPRPRLGTDWNYAYYPVLFSDEKRLANALNLMSQSGVYPRRYFCPSLNCLPYVHRCDVPYSWRASQQVACLPLSASLGGNSLRRVTDVLRSVTTEAEPRE